MQIFSEPILLDKEISMENTNMVKSPVEPFHGTTTVAFVYKGGIVVAVDSRASSGSYIASRSVLKVIEVNDYLLGTMAGGAADCFYWEKLMGIYAKEYSLKYNRRISVCAASMKLSNDIYHYKGKFSIGSMVCGYDNDFHIYYVDDSGKRIKGNLFSVGSGSTIAYSVLDSQYKYDMEKEEALNLGRDAVYHATIRDAYSGGSINLFHIGEEGVKKIGKYDVAELYEEKNHK
ncbi:20S proteasome core particle subunit beta 5 [Spraguea lophii 42_110]|uniref:Proteasome subunit beta n=1 Tax=Spraguea lophii (strain 42_110) TaxID=1358809 RepID=S7W8T5_SPRLO|nr:20S proteasome core particle subunit beta 5 [Spraguea lophii 42_110]